MIVVGLLFLIPSIHKKVRLYPPVSSSLHARHVFSQLIYQERSTKDTMDSETAAKGGAKPQCAINLKYNIVLTYFVSRVIQKDGFIEGRERSREDRKKKKKSIRNFIKRRSGNREERLNGGTHTNAARTNPLHRADVSQ